MSILIHSSAIPVHSGPIPADSGPFLWIPVSFLWTLADSSGMGSFLQESVGHDEVLISSHNIQGQTFLSNAIIYFLPKAKK